MRKFVGKYGDTQIATLTGSAIKEWLAGLRLVAKTRSRHFGYLNNAFTIAKKANALAANPLEGLEPFRVKRKTKVEILTPQEMQAFLSALHRDWLPFFAICAFTGLRREEVSRLDWIEIKLDRSLIFGVSATDRQITFKGMVVDRVVAGKMVDSRILMDSLGMMTQLGVIPSEKAIG